MKKIIFSTMIASLLAFVGCQNEELVKESTDNNNGKKVTLTATIAGAADSRVALTEVKDDENPRIINVVWKESGETFMVHGSSSAWSEFTQTQGNNFTGELPVGADYAYYGYTVSGNTISYDLSSQDGTLNENCVLMNAEVPQNPSKLQFEHQTAILKVKFKISGGTFNNTAITQIVMDNVHAKSGLDYSSITVTPSNKEFFYIFLPIKNNYDAGHTFNFTVTAGDNEYTGLLTIPEGMSIEPSQFYTAVIDLTPYLTFTATDSQILTLKKNDESEDGVSCPSAESLEYSVNGGAWTKFNWIENFGNSNDVTFGGENGNLRMRGKSESGMAADYENYIQIIFHNSGDVACSGDIRTLVNYENYSAAETDNARFCYLFSGCTSLTSAPALPAATLADHCYDSMFSGCTSLTSAPALPAATLAIYCYYGMFSGCTSLTSAPSLPATSLQNDCYQSMFSGCSSLTSAPSLPATSLAFECYQSMFSNCTSLTLAPSLPATSLAGSCYKSMFSGCSSLTSAPELSATKLKVACYQSMFSNCTSLTSAPSLPATSLQNNCYQSMFSNCTSLTSAPSLPATSLLNNCYQSMFSGCTNLNSVTMLATDISASNCLKNWLLNVASTGTFIKAASMTSLPTGASGIPSGWEVAQGN